MQSRRVTRIAPFIVAVVLTVAPASAQAPPSALEAQAAIDRSPRHGEWVSIESAGAPIKSWVMYPERSDKAPVVIVIHPGPTLNDWTRAVADRLAADGYIAIAPDLPTGDPGRTRNEMLDAVRDYALKIPAANGKIATLGFEQGGAASFEYALAQPALNAAIVFDANAPSRVARGRAPVLAIYADNSEAAARDAWARVLDFLRLHVQ